MYKQNMLKQYVFLFYITMYYQYIAKLEWHCVGSIKPDPILNKTYLRRIIDQSAMSFIKIHTLFPLNSSLCPDQRQRLMESILGRDPSSIQDPLKLVQSFFCVILLTIQQTNQHRGFFSICVNMFFFFLGI